MSARARLPLLATLTLGSLLVPLAAPAEDWKSRDASRALVEQMKTRQVDAIATRDPETPDRFVAALLLPGQLLVVSATHPSTDLVAARLQREEYRDIYMDLQATPNQDTRFFVHDIDADGLDLEGRGQAFDVIHHAGHVVTCDGKWKNTEWTADEYRQWLAETDARYARLLTALAESASAGEPTQ